jgi:glycosyltransferase involved in cell wall biosynthesis
MGEKPKILILNYEFPPLGGGGGVAAYVFAKEFIRAGYEVDYITTGFSGLQAFEKIDGISIYRIKVWGRKDLSTATMISLILFPIFAFWKGFSLCRQNKYSFIHTHFVVPTGPLGFVLSKIFKIKNILSLHGGDVYDPTRNISPHRYWILRMIIRFLINRADGVVSSSGIIKDKCIEYYKPRKEIKIIPLPYELVDFPKVSRHDIGLDENKKYVIGVGRLIPRKKFDVFLKMFSFLDKNIEGIIIGDGPEKNSLKGLAQSLKMEQRIHFTGFVGNKEKILQYMSCSDVFVLCPSYEGFGVVFQEAMQAGLPIVTTMSGGQADIVKDGKNGFLIPNPDEKLAAGKVNQILNSKEIHLTMKANNLRDIKRFSGQSVVAEFLKTFVGDKKL